MRESFYEINANSTFRFSDGTTLKICSGYLASQRSILHQLVISSTPENIVDIQDCDLNTFRLFLDCLMGFQECTVIDALMIFPIAWKYEAETLIEKCIEILKPTDLNENVCLTLNLALFCQCRKLTDILLKFLVKNQDFLNKFLDQEPCRLLLEPESVKELLNIIYKVEMDSCVVINVFKWADSYLKKKGNRTMDLKSFFKKHGIIDFLELKWFETSGAISDFNNSELGKGFFSPEECWNHFESSSFKIGKSAWFEIKAGDTLTEKFLIKDLSFFQNSVTQVTIFSNNRINYHDVGDVFEIRISADSSCPDFDVIADVKFGIFCDFCYFFKVMWRTNNCTVRGIDVELMFTFNGDGRILKQTPEDNSSVVRNQKDLYFFEKVQINQKELK